MKKVRLIKGLSYRGHGMYIKKGEVQSVDDSKAEELVAGGFFEIAGEASVNDDNSQNDANIDNGFKRILGFILMNYIPFDSIFHHSLLLFCDK